MSSRQVQYIVTGNIVLHYNISSFETSLPLETVPFLFWDLILARLLAVFFICWYFLVAHVTFIFLK